jgi:hypothetical protein
MSHMRQKRQMRHMNQKRQKRHMSYLGYVQRGAT